MNEENPLLVDTGRGFSVFYKNRNLYNTSEPRLSAEKRLISLKILPGTIVFIPSPLLFYGIDILMNKLPENSLVIAFELDSNLFSLQNTTGNNTYPRLHYIYNDTGKALQTISASGIWKYRRVILLTVSGGYALYKKEYTRIFETIEYTIKEYWQNRMTMIHMGPLWIKNIFINLNFLGSVPEKKIHWNFNGMACSKPVLVVGAGESLEYCISDIKKHRESILILAVDTALSVLDLHHIKPDFIVAVDSQFYNFYDILGYKNSTLPLFFDLTCFPPIIRNFKGNLFPFISNFTETALIKRLISAVPNLSVLPPLGSVGITALYLALELTDGPVMYTGLDFSYSIGKSHANGTPVHIKELSVSGRLSPPGMFNLFFQRPFKRITDKNGKTRITNAILSSYAQVMGKSFKKHKRIFDLGKTGIVSVGIRKESISDILQPGSVQTEKSSFHTEKNYEFPNEKLKIFLKKEATLLSLVYSEIFSWLSEKKSNEEKILRLLHKTDYLYLHFPDQSPEPNITPDYLKRVLVSTGHYSNILRNLSITF